jgi:hypothetical protein
MNANQVAVRPFSMNANRNEENSNQKLMSLIIS